MSSYDLLTSEEPLHDAQTAFSLWERQYSAGRKMGEIGHWLNTHGDVQLSVWDALASPLDRKMKRIRWSCHSCLFEMCDNDGRWILTRCRSCERQRCAYRTTQNMTAGVELLRRHGERARMITLTLKTTCVLDYQAFDERHRLLLEAKSLFKRAKRTTEWKEKITGYLFSFECPVRWHPCVEGLMKSPNKPQNSRAVPVTLNAHVHLVVTGKFWKQKELSMWAESQGFQPVVDIRVINSAKGVRYAIKDAIQYCAKEPSYGTVTRSSGGNIKQACRLTNWLYKNRKTMVNRTW